MSIRVVIGEAATDYYLANRLAGQFPDLKVIQYKQIKIKNLHYYSRKLKRFGLMHAAGIKLLSLFLRMEILLERLTRKNIWTSLGISKPRLSSIRDLQHCSNLDDLYACTKQSDLLIFTQTIRLNEKFFSKNRRIVQVIGGKFPCYSGDAAVFWAAALQSEQDYAFSLILRHPFFQKSSVISYCPITLAKGDSIRMMRAKGMVAATDELMKMINGYYKGEQIEAEIITQKPSNLTTPTLWDYFSTVFLCRKRDKIPGYARN